MKNKYYTRKRIIAIFFFALLSFIFNSLFVFADYSPQPNFTINGFADMDGDGGWDVNSYYDFKLVSYNSVKNEAKYTVTSHYWFTINSTLYSDELYINDTYIGTFKSKNGDYNADDEVYRNEVFTVTLHSGENIVETKNVDGIGGDSEDSAYIRAFATPPTVSGTNGTWYEGEVAKGLRTRESLYTDGATGSSAGNKTQTSTGFMYSDIDEQKIPVHAYSDTTLGHNSSITGIRNVNTGEEYSIWNFSPLNNVGTYLITSCTEDSGGLEGCGNRYIYVKERKYNIAFNGNGATSGSTPTQTCTVLYDCTLNANGFKKHYTVNYNGNGGTSTKSSDIANAAFLYWQNASKTYVDRAVVRDLSTTHGATVTMSAIWRNGSVVLPNATKTNAKFMGWHVNEAGGSKIGGNGSTYTPSGNTTIYAKWDVKPTINASNKTFYEGQYTSTYWQNTLRSQGVSASDAEDGNLTSKVKVIYDNTNVNKNGTYKVTYQVTDSVGNVTTKDVVVTVLYNNPPVISAPDKTFYENEYTAAQWLNTVRMSNVTASDKEDGTITNKVTVTYDNVNTAVPGIYKVTYKVTDSFGKTATRDVKVTVLYNNPPTINAEDRWFYDDEDVTNAVLMERVKANDIEDGNITAKAIIKASNVKNHVIGWYNVTYKITDRFGKTAETTVNIHIVKKIPTGDEYKTRLRFISKKYINTIDPNSVWRTPEFAEIMSNTLNKTEDSQAKEHWHLRSEDVKMIKEFNKTHGFSKESNDAFLEQFGYLLQ